jgi:hypothetical protein
VAGVKQRWSCLAQVFIHIIRFTSQKRYIPERRNIKRGGKMLDIERIIQTGIPDIAPVYGGVRGKTDTVGKAPMPIVVFITV